MGVRFPPFLAKGKAWALALAGSLFPPFEETLETLNEPVVIVRFLDT
jgi:hypothetical protein